MHGRARNPFRPASPEPLRAYLLRECSVERLRSIAAADHGRGAPELLAEFQSELRTGEHAPCAEDNAYECCLLHLHTDSGSDPLDALFAAWWIGAFCSSPDAWVLIDNLAGGGSMALLEHIVTACGRLGRAAAHAAAPMVLHLRGREPRSGRDDAYDLAIRALESVEAHGMAGADAGRFREFIVRRRSNPLGL